jgi:hypothetical protein
MKRTSQVFYMVLKPAVDIVCVWTKDKGEARRIFHGWVEAGHSPRFIRYHMPPMRFPTKKIYYAFDGRVSASFPAIRARLHAENLAARAA